MEHQYDDIRRKIFLHEPSFSSFTHSWMNSKNAYSNDKERGRRAARKESAKLSNQQIMLKSDSAVFVSSRSCRTTFAMVIPSEKMKIHRVQVVMRALHENIDGVLVATFPDSTIPV